MFFVNKLSEIFWVTEMFLICIMHIYIYITVNESIPTVEPDRTVEHYTLSEHATKSIDFLRFMSV